MKYFSKKWLNVKLLRCLAVAGIALLALWNTNSLVTGEIGTMFTPRHISDEYYRYRQFINAQNEYFRVLGIPVPSKWMVYTNRHPKVSMVDLTRGPWENFAIPHIDGHPERNERWLLSPLEQDFSDRLLDVSSIRYVVIPRDDPENADDFFGAYGERKVFLSHLDSLEYLKRIDPGTGDIVVYENTDVRPHLYLTQEPETIEKTIPFVPVDFSFVSPSQYTIQISSYPFDAVGQGENIDINFSESYHPDWKLRKGEFSWWSSLWEDNYFLPDSYHRKNDAGLNSFSLPKEMVENGETFTLFFRPQAHLYMGLILSGLVFAISIGYLLWKGISYLVQRKKSNIKR